MTEQTDNEGKRAENLSKDVEWMKRDNESMIREDKTMIAMTSILIANANAMELRRFRATAEAYASEETMKKQWDFRFNDM